MINIEDGSLFRLKCFGLIQKNGLYVSHLFCIMMDYRVTIAKVIQLASQYATVIVTN